jgi:hypothetical protein
MADTLLGAHPLRIKGPPVEQEHMAAMLECLASLTAVALPPGAEVEYIPPREAFDMLVAEGECIECGAHLPAGSLVWMKAAGPWWSAGRSGGWYHEPFPGMRFTVCQSCAAGVLLPWHRAQERERLKRRCQAARKAWLEPDGPEVRCVCGHLVEEHCLDYECFCIVDDEVELAGACLNRDCECLACRPESVFDFAERLLGRHEVKEGDEGRLMVSRPGPAFDVELAWQELLQARDERQKRDERDGPDPDSPTMTGLTVAS